MNVSAKRMGVGWKVCVWRVRVGVLGVVVSMIQGSNFKYGNQEGLSDKVTYEEWRKAFKKA